MVLCILLFDNYFIGDYRRTKYTNLRYNGNVGAARSGRGAGDALAVRDLWATPSTGDPETASASASREFHRLVDRERKPRPRAESEYRAGRGMMTKRPKSNSPMIGGVRYITNPARRRGRADGRYPLAHSGLAMCLHPAQLFLLLAAGAVRRRPVPPPRVR
jgi:hypothetical protein